MWDHWRNGIFTDSELLKNENELLKCILEKQRKEMILLAKQIALLTKRRDEINDKKAHSIDKPVPVPLEPVPESLPTVPQPTVFSKPAQSDIAATDPVLEPSPRPMKNSDNFPIIRSLLRESDSSALKTTDYQIVQIVPTLQPQFRIEALRKQPRKIAPKRSRSPAAMEDQADLKDYQPVRKSRRSKSKKTSRQKYDFSTPK